MPKAVAHTTVVTDTVQTTPSAGTPEPFVPQYIHGFDRSTPLKETDPLKDLQETIIEIPKGFPAEKIPQTPANNTTITVIVLVIFLLFAFTFKKGIKTLGQMLRSLFNVKERQSIFDDSTVRETQLRAILLCMTFISEGFFLFRFVTLYTPALSNFIGIGVCCGGVVALIFYLLQKWIYTGVGLLFSDPSHTRKWIESFIAINTLISIPFALLVLTTIFMPPTGRATIFVAGAIYLISRILFMYKGFKIFYRNILDLFYFIVYLCALEITPLFWVYKLSVLIYNFVALKI